jgi:hypothetical protein
MTKKPANKEESLKELHYLLTMDTSMFPTNMNPDLLELGNLAKTMMASGVIDHTFFTRNW